MPDGMVFETAMLPQGGLASSLVKLASPVTWHELKAPMADGMVFGSGMLAQGDLGSSLFCTTLDPELQVAMEDDCYYGFWVFQGHHKGDLLQLASPVHSIVFSNPCP